MHPFTRRFGALALIAAALWGCDSPSTPRTPAQVAAVSGSGQTGAAGAELPQPLVALVTDAQGRPVRGATVTWAATAGTVSPASSTTDGSGQASATWRLAASVGTATATATVSGLPPAQFTATATVPSGATLTKVSGDAQSQPGGGLLAQPLVVRVADASGQPLAGATVAWVGQGQVSAGTTLTDASGLATVQWTVPTHSGGYGMSVSVSGSSAPGVAFTATVPPAAPASLTILSPATGALVRGSLRIAASCGGCVGMRVTGVAPGFSFSGTSFDTTLTVGTPPGQPAAVVLTFSALNTDSVATSTTRPIVIDPTGKVLAVLATAPGQVLSYDGADVVYRDSAMTGLRLRSASGATDAPVSLPAQQPPFNFVAQYPGGVVFTAFSVGGPHLYQWSGTLTDLGPADGEVRVKGDSMAWRNGSTVTLRDLAARANVYSTPTDNPTSRGFDIGQNGDLVWIQGGQVYRDRAGAVTPLAFGAGTPVGVATDGRVVLVTVRNGSDYQTVRIDAGGGTLTLPGYFQPRLATGFGWSAVTTDATLTTVSPTGVRTDVALSFNDAVPYEIGPDGTVLMTVTVGGPHPGTGFLVMRPGAAAPVLFNPIDSFGFSPDDRLRFAGSTLVWIVNTGAYSVAP